jgi:hypothetical protein
METTEKLFGCTDYLVKEVNLLIVMGAIPEEFVEFVPDSGIKIDYLVTSFMEHFPKAILEDPWAEVFGNLLRYGLDLIQYETPPIEGVLKLDNGETVVAFRDTTMLSRELNISKSKLDKLLNRVITDNPDIQPFLMDWSRAGAGYVVCSFLLRQLEKKDVRLDHFLKKLANGQISFAVN